MLGTESQKRSAVLALLLAGCVFESAWGKTVSVVASSSSGKEPTVIINGKRYEPGEYKGDGTNVKYSTGKSSCEHKSVHVTSNGEETVVVMDEDKDCNGNGDSHKSGSSRTSGGPWSERFQNFEERVYKMGSEFVSAFGDDVTGEESRSLPHTTKKENSGTGKPDEPRTVEVHDGGNYASASSSGNGPHHEKATVTRTRSGTTTTFRASSSASASSSSSS